MIRASIFDFDGVLADTEPLHFRTFSAALAEVGIVLPDEDDGARYMGVADRHCFEMAYRDAGRGELSEEGADRLVEAKSRLFTASLHEIELFPGSREAIFEALRIGPATIASCGQRRDIEGVLLHHGILEHLPRIVTGGEVRRSKPDPECFLKALDLLRLETPDLEAGDCLVFEDSVLGIEAANRAGMRCVALAHTFPPAMLTGAERVIRSWSDWQWG